MGRSQFKYILYGFKVISEFDIGIKESQFDNCDISIKIGGLTENVVTEKELTYYSMDDDVVIIHVSEVACYTINQGTEIIIEKYNKDYDHNEICLYLLGTVFSFVLFYKKIFAIHGSAISINDRAVVFTGDSGAGKSSIARGFIQKGYKLLSDDVSVLNNEDDAFFVVPSYPSQKLWSDTSQMFKVETKDASRICNRMDKYNVDISDSFFFSKLPLEAVVLIVPSDVHKVTLCQVSVSEALEILINNTYRAEVIATINLQILQLQIMTQVASKIRVYVLNRPKGDFTVEKQMECVEKMVYQVEK